MDDLFPMGARKWVRQKRNAILHRDSLGAFDQRCYFGFARRPLEDCPDKTLQIFIAVMRAALSKNSRLL